MVGGGGNRVMMNHNKDYLNTDLASLNSLNLISRAHSRTENSKSPNITIF